MARGTTPPDQRGRPIGFRGNYGGDYDFVIRPEELTRYEPSRLAVQQTLGGAWIDCFDRGIITIKISGTTGWHGGPPDGGQPSGEEQFHQLRAGAFVAWHAARAEIIAGGGDPDVIQMIFVDALDGFVDLVAPKSFTLRRSKTRPLLMMYNIELLVLSDIASPVVGPGGFATVFGFIFGAATLAGAGGAIGGGAAGLAAGLG